VIEPNQRQQDDMKSKHKIFSIFSLPNSLISACHIQDSKILLISSSFSGSQFLIILNPKSHSQPHLKSRQFNLSPIKSDNYPLPVSFEHKTRAQKTVMFIHSLMTAIDFLPQIVNVSQKFCSKSQTVHIIQNKTQTSEYI